MKGVKMVLCNHLGIGNRSSLQAVQSGPHCYPVNIPKLLLLCISNPDLCLYNLSNTSKTRGLPYFWPFPWLRGAGSDVLRQSPSPSPNPTEHSPPCRDLSTRKSWTWLVPETPIAMPTHQSQLFHCDGLIPMTPIAYPKSQLLLPDTWEHQFPFTELDLSPVPRAGSISYSLLFPREQVGFKTCLHMRSVCLKCNLTIFWTMLCCIFSPLFTIFFYIAVFRSSF